MHHITILEMIGHTVFAPLSLSRFLRLVGIPKVIGYHVAEINIHFYHWCAGCMYC